MLALPVLCWCWCASTTLSVPANCTRDLIESCLLRKTHEQRLAVKLRTSAMRVATHTASEIYRCELFAAKLDASLLLAKLRISSGAVRRNDLVSKQLCTGGAPLLYSTAHKPRNRMTMCVHIPSARFRVLSPSTRSLLDRHLFNTELLLCSSSSP